MTMVVFQATGVLVDLALQLGRSPGSVCVLQCANTCSGHLECAEQGRHDILNGRQALSVLACCL